ncbi:glycosyltransferase [Cetobacterium sp. SF1]|uniref:glycosyltransferase n=1 Tax=Cetobacterium sp. SF1 TaxID=3417654 RepID=UPI003CEC8AAC
MKIEVLVATINQKNTDLYEKMNLQTDAIIANQSKEYSYIEKIKKNHIVKMITTKEIGVGRNRNQALLYATGDICLFADDDMCYIEGYEKIVKEAFQKIPKADIIIFNIETIGKETRKRRINTKIKKLNKFNILNYGAARIAIKRNEQLKKNIWFSLLYGGGALYSSGEDSLFLIEALQKGMNIYAYPEKIANIKQESSTWFKGYTEKYFEDKGYWIANAFPKLKYLVILYFFYKLSSFNKNFSKLKIYKFLKNGINKFDIKKENNEKSTDNK